MKISDIQQLIADWLQMRVKNPFNWGDRFFIATVNTTFSIIQLNHNILIYNEKVA
jgi:hypothetical protein